MTNGNLETRLTALETQMQETRDLLQQTAQNINRLEAAQERTQRQLDLTLNIANSNARSIQAWEALIEQNKVEAEEERSVLTVNVNNLTASMSQFRVDMDELRQASRENIAQHFDFRERFDRIQEQLDRE